jgi:hypothetical protein
LKGEPRLISPEVQEPRRPERPHRWIAFDLPASSQGPIADLSASGQLSHSTAIDSDPRVIRRLSLWPIDTPEDFRVRVRVETLIKPSSLKLIVPDEPIKELVSGLVDSD